MYRGYQKAWYQTEDFLFPVAVVSIIVLIIGLFILWHYPTDVKTMTIRSMNWSRTIQEYEYYTVYECRTRTRSKSNGDTETYQDCGNERKTRTTNEWVLTGNYPSEPAWPNYSIQFGRYERRYETYHFVFSDDIELYNYNGSYQQYMSYKPREHHKVALNWFSSIVGIVE